jgi:hypothetical protein
LLIEDNFDAAAGSQDCGFHRVGANVKTNEECTVDGDGEHGEKHPKFGPYDSRSPLKFERGEILIFDDRQL